MTRRARLVCAFSCAAALPIGAGLARRAEAQAAPPLRFGGEYAALDARRQALVGDWAARFTELTKRQLSPQMLYDDMLSLSGKTTFEAVTHALMTSQLTDKSGASIGDALGLVERVESIHGQVQGAAGDRQFRMYVQLKDGATATLDESQQFKRGADNTIFHKGYPINYRQQGGAPSIQISTALDRRRADIDVDYRSSSFPVAMFNGHLSSANSDVRAGNNSDRHSNRWAGFQNWWRSFFGINLNRPEEVPPQNTVLALPKEPRAGRKTIEVMVNDFLTAWLLEGDAANALAYFSERAYACLAQDYDDPLAFDRGLAPYELLMKLKAASDELGPHNTLVGLTVGVRMPLPRTKVVTQPHHAQFVIYVVRDDAAAEFDCQSRMSAAEKKDASEEWGNYFASTFYIDGKKDHSVALLWGREDGYWKIVSWQTGLDGEPIAAPPPPPSTRIVKIKGDPSLARASREFLESWLIRKDYDAAFRYLSETSYACFNLIRDSQTPAAASLEEAGRRLRAGFEQAGAAVGKPRTLEDAIVAVEPFNPSSRIMEHSGSRSFTLTSVPQAAASAADCTARTSGGLPIIDAPPVYGRDYGMSFRFRTRGGEAPVLRTLWAQQDGAWRITVVDLEIP